MLYHNRLDTLAARELYDSRSAELPRLSRVLCCHFLCPNEMTVKYLIHKHLAALVLKDVYMNVPFRY